MKPTQTWVGYAARSFETIKQSLLARLAVNAPEITDHSESNPLIILVSQFAGVAETLHLYIDARARESFIGTARRYNSIVKIAKLLDYHPKARVPATADILFQLVDGSNEPTDTTTPILIPKNTLIGNISSNIVFRTIKDTLLPGGSSRIMVQTEQFTPISANTIGTTSSSSLANQAYPISEKYATGTMEIIIGGDNWQLYGSFGLMGPTTKGVIVTIDENQVAYLMFGDGINGAIPPPSTTIYASYKETEGTLGNLPPGNLTVLQTTLPLPAGLNFSITNPDYSSNGSDFQTLEEIRKSAPLSLSTLSRAVTAADYENLAMLYPGVGAAKIKYCCGKYVDIYIVPNSKGSATAALCEKVRKWVECKVMVTTIPSVKPAGNSRIWISAKIIPIPLADPTQVWNQVAEAWDQGFGYGNPIINREVSITDIIALTKQLSLVDNIEIAKLKIEPYVRPITETANPLLVTFTVLPTTSTLVIYRLVYKAVGNVFQIFKNGVYIADVAENTNYTDGAIIGFNIPSGGSYTNNDTWEFRVHPTSPEIFPSTTIEVKDFSAAVMDIGPYSDDDTQRTIFGDISIEASSENSSCLPNCE